MCLVTVGDRLEAAYEAFTDGLPAGASIVLHFSGHGSEEDGKNYLIPIDGRTSTAAGRPLWAESPPVHVSLWTNDVLFSSTVRSSPSSLTIASMLSKVHRNNGADAITLSACALQCSIGLWSA